MYYSSHGLRRNWGNYDVSGSSRGPFKMTESAATPKQVGFAERSFVPNEPFGQILCLLGAEFSYVLGRRNDECIG